MKIVTLLCLMLLILTGCAMHYDVTLFNGTTYRSASKPKLNDRGYYIFKDTRGKDVEVNSIKVRKIEAVNPGDPSAPDFN